MNVPEIIKSHGFRLFMRRPDSEYGVYTNQAGTLLAYAQWGVDHCIGTMHVPNRSHGTGYVITRSPQWGKSELEAGLALAPDWAPESDLLHVKKWENIEDFINSNNFNAEYKEF